LRGSKLSIAERAQQARASPQALLVRTGLRLSGTAQVEEWMKVRSELGVAITAAFAAEKIALR
jgi:hypothetical protein